MNPRWHKGQEGAVCRVWFHSWWGTAGPSLLRVWSVLTDRPALWVHLLGNNCQLSAGWRNISPKVFTDLQPGLVDQLLGKGNTECHNIICCFTSSKMIFTGIHLEFVLYEIQWEKKIRHTIWLTEAIQSISEFQVTCNTSLRGKLFQGQLKILKNKVGVLWGHQPFLCAVTVEEDVIIWTEESQQTEARTRHGQDTE